jgi:RNA recognition motif-containing protein
MASKLYVGGLSYSTTSESLRSHFAQCGTVESAQVVTDRVTSQSRGFGFVEMATEAEAKAAIAKIDGQPFEGRRLKVDIATSQGAKSGGAGGGGGARSGGGFGSRVRTARW